MTTFSVCDRRVKPTTRRPFGEGLIEAEKPGRSTPIDQRTLPTIDGAGLTLEEWFRVNGSRNRAMAFYAADMPEATPGEIDAVGDRAATDSLRAVLRDRPAAPALPERVSPMIETAILPRRTDRPVQRTYHSPADEVWWAQFAPPSPFEELAPICGGAPEPEAELGPSGAWFLPGDTDLEPEAIELSDDASGAFLGHVA